MLKPSLALRSSNVIGYILLIAVNFASSRGWLGPTNEKLSKKNHTPITPAGWAFSIWGLIFLLQGLGVVFQTISYGYDADAKALAIEAIGYWWIAGWVAECAWQFFFQMQTRGGMWICMFCLLTGLASFARALSNLYRLSSKMGPFPPLVNAFYFQPTSINTAWLSVASCIGILIVANIQGSNQLELGALILAALTTAASCLVLVTQHDTAYGCVLIWALIAVAAKQPRSTMAIASWFCVAVNLFGVLFSLLHPRMMTQSPAAYTEL